MAKMQWYDIVAYALLTVGGLNWGLAVFDVNLVTALFGTGLMTMITYGLVGVAALYAIASPLIRKLA